MKKMYLIVLLLILATFKAVAADPNCEGLLGDYIRRTARVDFRVSSKWPEALEQVTEATALVRITYPTAGHLTGDLLAKIGRIKNLRVPANLAFFRSDGIYILAHGDRGALQELAATLTQEPSVRTFAFQLLAEKRSRVIDLSFSKSIRTVLLGQNDEDPRVIQELKSYLSAREPFFASRMRLDHESALVYPCNPDLASQIRKSARELGIPVSILKDDQSSNLARTIAASYVKRNSEYVVFSKDQQWMIISTRSYEDISEHAVTGTDLHLAPSVHRELQEFILRCFYPECDPAEALRSRDIPEPSIRTDNLPKPEVTVETANENLDEPKKSSVAPVPTKTADIASKPLIAVSKPASIVIKRDTKTHLYNILRNSLPESVPSPSIFNKDGGLEALFVAAISENISDQIKRDELIKSIKEIGFKKNDASQWSWAAHRRIFEGAVIMHQAFKTDHEQDPLSDAALTALEQKLNRNAENPVKKNDREVVEANREQVAEAFRILTAGTDYTITRREIQKPGGLTRLFESFVSRHVADQRKKLELLQAIQNVRFRTSDDSGVYSVQKARDRFSTAFQPIVEVLVPQYAADPFSDAALNALRAKVAAPPEAGTTSKNETGKKVDKTTPSAPVIEKAPTAAIRSSSPIARESVLPLDPKLQDLNPNIVDSKDARVILNALQTILGAGWQDRVEESGWNEVMLKFFARAKVGSQDLKTIESRLKRIELQVNDYMSFISTTTVSRKSKEAKSRFMQLWMLVVEVFVPNQAANAFSFETATRVTNVYGIRTKPLKVTYQNGPQASAKNTDLAQAVRLPAEIVEKAELINSLFEMYKSDHELDALASELSEQGVTAQFLMALEFRSTEKFADSRQANAALTRLPKEQIPVLDAINQDTFLSIPESERKALREKTSEIAKTAKQHHLASAVQHIGQKLSGK